MTANARLNKLPPEVILWGGTGQAKVVRPIYRALRLEGDRGIRRYSRAERGAAGLGLKVSDRPGSGSTGHH